MTQEDGLPGLPIQPLQQQERSAEASGGWEVDPGADGYSYSAGDWGEWGWGTATL